MKKGVIEQFDKRIIHNLNKISIPLARFSLFIVFFWFGILKVFMLSPANELVQALLIKIMPSLHFETFIVFFGLLEMFIGLAFILPRMERVAIALLFFHMITTVLPLFLLPELAWQSFLVPTLEGQYILKNMVIIATAIAVASHLHPMRHHRWMATFSRK